jgi:solute:Na+ symporter, SSS family
MNPYGEPIPVTGGLVAAVMVGIGLYWLYCLYWSYVGWRTVRTGAGWAIAGRTLPAWLFLLAASATSFSAWTFIGHPGTIYSTGLAYAFAGLYAITIPFTGALFIKRQWMLGRRYGFVTPPEQYRAMFDSPTIALLIILVSFLYSVFYVAVQLVGAGLLFTVITGGFFPFLVGSAALATIMLLYVGAGGLRTIAWVDALQFFLLIGGISLIGAGVMNGLGGWGGMIERINTLPGYWTGSHGVMIFSANWLAPAEGAMRPHWTGVMMFSYMFALAGIQASPAFTMWSYSLKHTRLLGWQVTFGIGTIVTVTLVLWSVVQGLGAQYLAQAVPASWSPAALQTMIRDAGASGSGSDAVVPRLMLTYLPIYLIPLAALGLLAAAQSTGAPYISSFAAIASRNLIGDFLRRRARKRMAHTMAGGAGAVATGGPPPPQVVTLDMVLSQSAQVNWSRFFCLVLLACSLYVAFFQADYMVMLGGLAVSYAFQLYPALLMICYAFRGWPTRWTPQAIIAGLVAGIVGVTVTYYWPAYRYPLSIHSAGWGILANLLVIWIVSPLTTPSQRFLDMQKEIDQFFRSHDPEFYTARAKWWQNFLWFYAPFWWLMFVGPGIELGNYFDGVLFGAPGLWLWLILGGATGTWLLYVMCFPAQMATAPRTTPEPIDEEARLTITEV